MLSHTPIPQSEAPSAWLALDIGTCGDQPSGVLDRQGASPQPDFPEVGICLADRDLERPGAGEGAGEQPSANTTRRKPYKNLPDAHLPSSLLSRSHRGPGTLTSGPKHFSQSVGAFPEQAGPVALAEATVRIQAGLPSWSPRPCAPLTHWRH